MIDDSLIFYYYVRHKNITLINVNYLDKINKLLFLGTQVENTQNAIYLG